MFGNDGLVTTGTAVIDMYIFNRVANVGSILNNLTYSRHPDLGAYGTGNTTFSSI